jgi:AraC-like DNA-binding protein
MCGVQAMQIGRLSPRHKNHCRCTSAIESSYRLGISGFDRGTDAGSCCISEWSCRCGLREEHGRVCRQASAWCDADREQHRRFALADGRVGFRDNARGSRASMTPSDAVSAVSSADQSLAEKEPIVLRREAMAPWQARTLQAYIASHLHSTIRVMDLVRVVQFAPNRFDRVFKNSFGCTPHQYVMRTRIARAQSRLLMSNDTLSKIAAECGFVNQSHLSNLFRKTMGQPPGKWRSIHGARQ